MSQKQSFEAESAAEDEAKVLKDGHIVKHWRSGKFGLIRYMPEGEPEPILVEGKLQVIDRTQILIVFLVEHLKFEVVTISLNIRQHLIF